MFACLLFFSICKGEPVGATSHGDPAFNPYLILMMVAWSGRRFPLLSPACISKARYPLEILGTFWDAAMRDWTSSIRKVRNHHPIKLSFWRLYIIYICVCMDIYYIPIHPEFLANFPLDRFCIGLVSPLGFLAVPGRWRPPMVSSLCLRENVMVAQWHARRSFGSGWSRWVLERTLERTTVDFS